MRSLVALRAASRASPLGIPATAWRAGALRLHRTHADPYVRGEFTPRREWSNRDWTERAFTIGIGGPVGSGKTALVLQLCRRLRERLSIAVVTNDIFTKEVRPRALSHPGPVRPEACCEPRQDAEFLTLNGALPEERITAVETGGCPHAAIREDISANLAALEQLTVHVGPDLLLCESGGDNLAANFSSELADYTVYVIGAPPALPPAPTCPACRHCGQPAPMLCRCGGRRQGAAQGRAWHHAVRCPGDQQIGAAAISPLAPLPPTRPAPTHALDRAAALRHPSAHMWLPAGC